MREGEKGKTEGEKEGQREEDCACEGEIGKEGEGSACQEREGGGGVREGVRHSSEIISSQGV